MFFIMDLEESLFSFFELFCGSRSETEVPVEIVIVDEVWSNRFKIHQYIIELLKNEEALGHALSSWNGITLRWRSSHHLEKVLGNSQMLFLLWVLTDNSMDDSLQDIFLWDNTLHIFNKIVSIGSLIILEIINNQIESSFRNDVNEWWKYLKSVFSSSEYNQIVSQQIIVVEHIAWSRWILESFEFSLGSFTIVQLEMVACLEVNSNDRILV